MSRATTTQRTQAEIIHRDASRVVDTAMERYQHHLNEGDAPGDAAFSAGRDIAEECDAVQSVYYAEAILADGPAMSSYVSENLGKDFAPAPDDIAHGLLARVVSAYLRATAVRPDETIDRPESRPPQGTPPTLPPNHDYAAVLKDLEESARRAYERADGGRDGLREAREASHDHLREIAANWSWTEQYQFIEFLRREHGVATEMPEEQIHISPSDGVDELVFQAVYWTLSTHVENILGDE